VDDAMHKQNFKHITKKIKRRLFNLLEGPVIEPGRNYPGTNPKTKVERARRPREEVTTWKERMTSCYEEHR